MRYFTTTLVYHILSCARALVPSCVCVCVFVRSISADGDLELLQEDDHRGIIRAAFTASSSRVGAAVSVSELQQVLCTTC